MPADSVPYIDDTTIADDAELWRRIHPNHIVRNDSLGGRRISRAAFTDSTDGTSMSVVIGEVVVSSGRDPQSVIGGREGFSLAAITAGLARTLGQGVVRRPLPEEPAHAEVFGKKTRSVQRSLAKAATWIVAPDS
jgi:hypothetical protein